MPRWHSEHLNKGKLQELEFRSQELQEFQNTRATPLSENPDPQVPGKIFANLPDSLAPELLQLLIPEFLNVVGSQVQGLEKHIRIFD
jgi:hypothetical protein